MCATSGACHAGRPDAILPSQPTGQHPAQDQRMANGARRGSGAADRDIGRPVPVIAVPGVIAGTVNCSSRHVGWRTLFPQPLGGPPASLHLQIQLPDPARSVAGLATLVEVRRLLGNRSQARGEFTSFVHNVVPTASFDDPQALSNLAALAGPPWHAGPVTVALGEVRGRASLPTVTRERSNHQNDRIDPKPSETVTIPVNRLASMRVILNEARRERGAGPHHSSSGIRPWRVIRGRPNLRVTRCAATGRDQLRSSSIRWARSMSTGTLLPA